MTKHMRVVFHVSWAILAISLMISPFQNCAQVHESSGSSDESSEAANVSFYAAQARDVLQSRCVSCHNPSSTPLAEPTDILNVDSLILGKFVVPGKPQSSPLYLDVIDGLMPQGGPALSDSEIEILANWIWVLGNPSGNPVIVGTGGSGGGAVTPATAPTFTRVNNEVIIPRCIGCHQAGSGRSLAGYNAVKAFTTGSNAVGSLLYQEVNSNSMPTAPNAPLTVTQKLLIFNWITAGALNN